MAMKNTNERPFSSGMRRVLTIALSSAPLFATSSAFADETAPMPTTATESAPAADAPVVVAPVVDEAPAATAPTPVREEAPAPPPREETIAAPTTAPVKNNFAMTMNMKPVDADRPVEAPSTHETRTETLRVGALMGVGFPRPFAAEAFIKVKERIGVGVEYSFLPTTNISATEVKFSGIAADLRLFPFKGGFFIGARAGKQWLSTKTAFLLSQRRYNESMEADAIFVNPRIGFLKTFDNGITVGLDAGVQLPVSASFARGDDFAKLGIKTTDADKTLLAVANTLGNKATPSVDLRRVGFLF
jgi:hypothetical protein